MNLLSNFRSDLTQPDVCALDKNEKAN